MTVQEYNQTLQHCIEIYFVFQIFFTFMCLFNIEEISRSQTNPKTFFRWFIAWPVLIPMWIIFWFAVFLEWILIADDKKEFESWIIKTFAPQLNETNY